MNLDLTGKVIALSGASRGFGRALAERLAAEGAILAIAARTVADLAEAHVAIETQGGQCLAFACDLAEPGEAAGFIAATLEVFGQIDALVCIAGAGWGDPDMALGLTQLEEAANAALPSLKVREGALLVCLADPVEMNAVAAARAAFTQGFAAAHPQVRSNALAVSEEAISTTATVDLAAFALSPRAAALRGVRLTASV